MTDIIGQYAREKKELLKTKEFLMQLQPSNFDLKSMLISLDQKINQADAMLEKFRGKNVYDHYCGLCDRGYKEDPPVSANGFKVCPACRKLGKGFLYSSDFERRFDLPEGTIKRDCKPIKGSPPRLQPYMDCGLVNQNGSKRVVHEIMYELYYGNESLYRPRTRRKNKKAL